MTLGLLGKKLGMTQIFKDDGTCVPVTVVQAGPCKVLDVKMAAQSEYPEAAATAATNLGKKRGKTARPRAADGYYAVQVGFGTRKAKNTAKPQLAQCKKVGLENGVEAIREFRLPAASDLKPGDDVTVGILKGVTHVDVTGVTKGRGWTGTIKRWNFSRQPTSHGNSVNHRTGGGLGRQHSISSGVPKGKKMAGHYGTEKVTVQAMEVVKVDEERNLVYLRGAVPGHRDGILTLRKSVKNRGAKK